MFNSCCNLLNPFQLKRSLVIYPQSYQEIQEMPQRPQSNSDNESDLNEHYFIEVRKYISEFLTGRYD